MSPCSAVHREFPAFWDRYEAPDVALHLTLSSTQKDAGEGACVDGLVTTVASKRVCASLPRHVVSLSCALDVERPPSRAFWTKSPPKAIVIFGRKEFGCLAWRLTPCPINLSQYLCSFVPRQERPDLQASTLKIPSRTIRVRAMDNVAQRRAISRAAEVSELQPPDLLGQK
jgi:hypothetical protein